jgi:hypothetical protein
VCPAACSPVLPPPSLPGGMCMPCSCGSLPEAVKAQGLEPFSLVQHSLIRAAENPVKDTAQVHTVHHPPPTDPPTPTHRHRHPPPDPDTDPDTDPPTPTLPPFPSLLVPVAVPVPHHELKLSPNPLHAPPTVVWGALQLCLRFLPCCGGVCHAAAATGHLHSGGAGACGEPQGGRA